MDRITHFDDNDAKQVIEQAGLRTQDGTCHWGHYRIGKQTFDLNSERAWERLREELVDHATELGFEVEWYLDQFHKVTRTATVTYSAATSSVSFNDL